MYILYHTLVKVEPDCSLSNCCFQNKMAAEIKQIIEEKIEEIKAHTIPLKAKEATIYGVNLFP